MSTLTRVALTLLYLAGIAGLGLVTVALITASRSTDPAFQHDSPIDRYHRHCDAERLLLRDGMRDLHTNPDVGEQMHRLLAQSDWREVRMCMPDDVTDWRIGCEEHDRGCMQLEMFSAVVRMSTP